MTTSQDQNSRIETRLDQEETILLEIIASDTNSAGSVIMCHSLDLSANGLQVILDEEISLGTILRICIDLAHTDPIFLVGEVKWKRPDEESGGWRIGFLLFEADDTDIQRWKAFVADQLSH